MAISVFPFSIFSSSSRSLKLRGTMTVSPVGVTCMVTFSFCCAVRREAGPMVRLLLLHIVVGTNLPLVGFKWIYMYVESTCTVRSDVRCGKKCDNVIRSRSTCTAAIILNDFCYRFYSTQEFILHTPCTYGQLRDDMSCTRALTTFSPSPSS